MTGEGVESDPIQYDETTGEWTCTEPTPYPEKWQMYVYWQYGDNQDPTLDLVCFDPLGCQDTVPRAEVHRTGDVPSEG
jgi:hypothetical protein